MVEKIWFRVYGLNFFGLCLIGHDNGGIQGSDFLGWGFILSLDFVVFWVWMEFSRRLERGGVHNMWNCNGNGVITG